jgi:hypothetical protein
VGDIAAERSAANDSDALRGEIDTIPPASSDVLSVDRLDCVSEYWGIDRFCTRTDSHYIPRHVPWTKSSRDVFAFSCRVTGEAHGGIDVPRHSRYPESNEEVPIPPSEMIVDSFRQLLHGT